MSRKTIKDKLLAKSVSLSPNDKDWPRLIYVDDATKIFNKFIAKLAERIDATRVEDGIQDIINELREMSEE